MDLLRRFCAIGGPDRCVQRLRRLIGLGLSHLTVVGGSRDIDSAARERSDRLVAERCCPRCDCRSADRPDEPARVMRACAR